MAASAKEARIKFSGSLMEVQCIVMRCVSPPCPFHCRSSVHPWSVVATALPSLNPSFANHPRRRRPLTSRHPPPPDCGKACRRALQRRRHHEGREPEASKGLGGQGDQRRKLKPGDKDKGGEPVPKRQKKMTTVQEEGGGFSVPKKSLSEPRQQQ